jgi:hypothetical protein
MPQMKKAAGKGPVATELIVRRAEATAEADE